LCAPIFFGTALIHVLKCCNKCYRFLLSAGIHAGVAEDAR
jgi:hypothetical protein